MTSRARRLLWGLAAAMVIGSVFAGALAAVAENKPVAAIVGARSAR